MARYIDAETLLEFVKQYTPHINGETTMECVETAILNAPTADVEEVRHGEWEAYGLANPRCSLCHEYNYEKSRFCPHCGAKMDGGKNENV